MALFITLNFVRAGVSESDDTSITVLFVIFRDFITFIER